MNAVMAIDRVRILTSPDQTGHHITLGKSSDSRTELGDFADKVAS